jgi:hypothetical protein
VVSSYLTSGAEGADGADGADGAAAGTTGKTAGTTGKTAGTTGKTAGTTGTRWHGWPLASEQRIDERLRLERCQIIRTLAESD